MCIYILRVMDSTTSLLYTSEIHKKIRCTINWWIQNYDRVKVIARGGNVTRLCYITIFWTRLSEGLLVHSNHHDLDIIVYIIRESLHLWKVKPEIMSWISIVRLISFRPISYWIPVNKLSSNSLKSKELRRITCK